MKNILFLLRFFPEYGGGEIVTLQLSKEFIARNYNVYILYLWDSNNGLQFNKLNLDDIHAIKVPDIHLPVDIDQIDSQDYDQLRTFIDKIVTKYRISFVINQWWPSCILKELNDAYVIKCHHTAVIQSSKKRNIAKKFLGDWILKIWPKNNFQNIYHDDALFCNKWIFLSNSSLNEARWIFSKHPKLLDKMMVINNPCRYKSVDKSVVAKKEKIVLYVGRLSPEKNIKFLIDSWKNIESSIISSGWKLFIVGCGTEYEPLMQYASEIGCCNIEFLGKQDPYDLYLKAAIFVLTSDLEGWPLVTIEAMSCGCVPVIRGTFSAAYEIVDNNEDGLIINGNENIYSDELLRLIKNDQKRFDMARRALKNSAKFSTNEIVDKWEKLFSEAMQ